MEYIFSVLMLILCCFSVALAYRYKDGRYYFIGVTGLFSVGYYVLPVMFKAYSGLEIHSSDDISIISGLCLVFYLFIILGNISYFSFLRMNDYKGLTLSALDEFSERYQIQLFFVSFVVWIAYFYTADLTSYSAEDFESFFHERSAFDGLLSALSGFALAWMATVIAMSYKSQSQSRVIVLSIIYFGLVVLLLSTGQRLAVITPIFTMVAAFSVFGLHKISLKIIVTGIAFLGVISPFMVVVREFQGVAGKEKVLAASGDFTIGDGGFFESTLLSIMQRADLIEVSIYLKKLFDSQGLLPWDYYASVIYSFIPGFLMSYKPYPLSDTGTIWGEISVVAWLLLQGNSTGSLTAFGAISAYREGGWIWVPFSGILVGILFGFIFSYLGKGGTIGRWLYGVVFVTVCIKNVPPSFFQLVVYMASTVNTVISLILLNWIAAIFFFKKYKSIRE